MKGTITGARDRADDRQDPLVVANDIFGVIQEDEVVFSPGYVGRQQD